MQKYLTVVATIAAISLTLVVTSAASAAQVSYPRTPAPSWFTPSFKQKVDAAGPTGVPITEAGPGPLDVCPGVVTHENAVGTGTCLVFPYGCTANFVYYNGSSATAPAVADGHLYLGSAGHCSDKTGQVVYGQISTPGVGASIVRIGTVSKRVENYGNDGSVLDFEAIQIDSGLHVYPDSPVGGPQGIYTGCQVGTPVKLWGHGYAIAMGQGKPEGGISEHWYDSGYGWDGPSFPGDSGSGVINAATGEAAGDLDAIVELYVPPVYTPGEIIGTRITSILSFLGSGYKLVNADQTLSGGGSTACGQPSGNLNSVTSGGGGGKGGKGGGGKPPKSPKL
jgi:hypothetical protein